MAMLIGQLSGRKSLRDITDNLKAQQNRLYHLGMKPTSRAALVRVNKKQPASLYKVVFFDLLKKCRFVTPGHKFSFKNKLYLLDTTTIDLCLAVFPWAEFRKRKGAIKLLMGIDADGYLPTFMDMTDGKLSNFSNGSNKTSKSKHSWVHQEMQCSFKSGLPCVCICLLHTSILKLNWVLPCNKYSEFGN